MHLISIIRYKTTNERTQLGSNLRNEKSESLATRRPREIAGGGQFNNDINRKVSHRVLAQLDPPNGYSIYILHATFANHQK